MATPSAVNVLALAAMVLLAAVGLPLWKPLLVAAVLAGALSHWHDRLAQALGNRRSLSAALGTVGAVLVVLIPLALLGVLVVHEAADLTAMLRRTLEEKGPEGLLAPLPDWLERLAKQALERWGKQPRQLMSELHVWSRTGWALGMAAQLAGSVSRFVLMLGLMLVALFFLLRDGHELVGWMERTSPLPASQLRGLLAELGRVSRSVIGANVLTGLIQASVATIGYRIAGVPSPILFGVLTLAASFVPSVGTMLVALPLVGLLWLMDRGGWAIFLLVWSVFVSGLVDNLVRPYLVKGKTELHGALIFFSLVGGILTFGAMGLIVGPLALALFMSVTNIRYRQRVETK